MIKLNCRNKRDSKMLRFWAEYFGLSDIYITVCYSRIVGDFSGMAIPRNSKNSSWWIFLNKRQMKKNGFTVEQIIAHELKHVQQFVRGDLEMIGDTVTRWKSSYWFGEINEESIYSISPWEIEAIEAEKLTEII